MLSIKLLQDCCYIFLNFFLTNALYSRHFHFIFACSGGARVDLVDQDGHSLLHWAALGGNADVCQILIENKINPNVQDYAGRTPLQCAAYGGYINCMAVLMENNADPNIQDKEVEILDLFCTVCSKVFGVLLLCQLKLRKTTIYQMKSSLTNMSIKNALYLSMFSSSPCLYIHV